MVFEVQKLQVFLQPEVAQVACKSTCEHIANSILALLLNDDIKQISMGALNQINLDLLQCERKLEIKLQHTAYPSLCLSF